MKIFRTSGKKLSTRPETIPAGNYHFVKKHGRNVKQIHLRVESDGNGTLLINASRIYYFNPSAVLMAYTILQDKSKKDALKVITDHFNISKTQAESDFEQFFQKFEPIISPDGDPCPICDLDLEVIPPFSKPPSAPYRMDLAVTYRCNNDCIHCYNSRDRGNLELSTEKWKEVLDHLWQLGIPHVVFTGGEPTLRDDLPELIHHAVGLGLITGINTNARRLKDEKYVQSLVAAGLDHIQITVESHDAAIHDSIVRCAGAWQQTVAGLRNALHSHLFVMTNTTLLKNNTASLEKTLQFLSDLGVPTIGLNGLIYSGRGANSLAGIEEKELPALLAAASSFTDAHGQRLIWYTPTQYCQFDPVTFGLGVKGCTAATYNMCIEPDGSVIPCQSYYHSLGNFLEDNWSSIWQHELARSIREKHYLRDDCRGCNLLSECGGGCPLTLVNEVPQKQGSVLQASSIQEVVK